MSINMKRRTLLKSSLGAGSVGLAVATGLLTPQMVLANWPTKAFEAKSQADALSAMGLTGAVEASGDIKIKAPDIAENGAVVPVTVTSAIAGTESIMIFASSNQIPLTSEYILGAGAESKVSTRLKMGKTGDVTGVIKAGGKLYSAKKEVKVTIGGCGG